MRIVVLFRDQAVYSINKENVLQFEAKCCVKLHGRCYQPKMSREML